MTTDMRILTERQSEKLAQEITSISNMPKDEPHIAFRLTFDTIRRRQMKDAGEGAEPPIEEAMEEAKQIVQKDFEGFEPQVGATDDSNPPSYEHDKKIWDMVQWLAATDPTDATRLKWTLMPEDKRQQMRKKYDSQDTEDRKVIYTFRDEVTGIHNQRDPQQEQFRQLGLTPEEADREVNG